MKKFLCMLLAVMLIAAQMGGLCTGVIAADDVLLTKNFDDTENGYGEYETYTYYPLSQTMTSDGIWKIKYDVRFTGNLPASSVNNRTSVWLTKETDTPLSDNGNCWDMLSMAMDGTTPKFYSATKAIDGIEAATDKWYTVEVVLGKDGSSGNAKVTITDKENKANTTTQMINLYASAWGRKAIGNYTRFAVTPVATSGTALDNHINLDNIEVTTAKDYLKLWCFNKAHGVDVDNYGEYTKNWSYTPIALSGSMTSTGVWQIKYDVCFNGGMNEYGVSGHQFRTAVWLAKDGIDNALTDNGGCWEMLSMANDGGTPKFYSARDTAINGVEAKVGTWYTVDAILSKDSSAGTGTARVTVTERGNAANTATQTVNLSGSSAGRTGVSDYAKLGVTVQDTTNTLYLDNVEIKESETLPSLTEIKFFNEAGALQSGLNNKVRAIEFIFSEEMKAESLEGAVKINDVTASGTLAADNKTYRVEIDALEGGTVATIKVLDIVKSLKNMPMLNTFVKNFNVLDADTVLNLDFNNNQTSHSKADGGASDSMVTAANGYFTLDLDNASYGNIMWFINPAATGGKYKVNFDVNFATATQVGTRSNIRIGKRTSNGDAYGGNAILGYSDGKLISDSTVVLENAVLNKWYVCEATFNGTNFSIKVKERDTQNAQWSEAVNRTITEIPEIDTLWAGYADLSLDNVKIKMYEPAPEIGEVKFINSNGTQQATFNNTVNTIVMVFTDEMNEASLTGAVKVNNEVVNGTLAADKKTYSIETSMFDSGSTVTVEVANTVKSLKNIAMESAYSKSYTVVDTGTVLNLDFNNNQTSHSKADGGANNSMATAANGYFTLDLTEDQTNGHIMWFINSSATGGKYKMTFDINFASETQISGRDNVRIGKRANDGDAYGGNGVLGFSGGKLVSKGAAVLENAVLNTWYSCEAVIDGTSLSVKVKERDNVEAEWSSAVNNTITEIPEINTLWVGSADVSLDNVVIKEEATAPVLREASVTLKDAMGNVVAKAAANAGIKTIEIDFGQEIIKSSMTDITLKAGDTPVSFDGAPAADSSKYILSNLSLEAGVTYTLAVSGVKNIFNQVQPGNFVYTFTTEKAGLYASLVAIKNGEATVTELSGLTGELSIELNAKNTTSETKAAVLMIAYYSDDRLEKLDAIDMSFVSGENGVRTEPYTFAQPTGCDAVKVMLWESMQNVVPLSRFLAVPSAQ